MKKKAIVIFCLTAMLVVGGCVSFKIEPLPDPEQLLEIFVLCKRVVPDGELLAPADITTDFVRADLGVHCFVELKNVGRAMTLKWKWYGPDGMIFKETVDVPVNENELYLETVTAYDKLDIPQGEGFEGRWVVVLLVNGKLAGRRSFNVR
jgi:hypothetical protein